MPVPWACGVRKFRRTFEKRLFAGKTSLRTPQGQLGREQVERMSSAEIVQAQKEGRLKDLGY